MVDAQVPSAEENNPTAMPEENAGDESARAQNVPADLAQPEKSGAQETKIKEAVAEEGTPPTSEGPKRAWYVVHCYSGYENKVKKGLEQRINSMGMQDRIYRVVVPIEKEVEIKEGQRRNIERRVFPGYILVEMMELQQGDPVSDEAWYVV